MAIQQPDPRARQMAIRLFKATLVLFTVTCLIAYLNPDWVSAVQRSSLNFFSEKPIRLFYMALIILMPLFFIAAYLFLSANKTVKQKRFPHISQKVIRPTKVLDGEIAVRHGRMIQALSAMLFTLTAGFLFILWHLLNGLINQM